MTVEQLIKSIIAREGGFVNNPADKGGPTKYGITLTTLQEYSHNPSLTADYLEKMLVEKAYEIYYNKYVVGPGFDSNAFIPALSVLLVDMFVNHGPKGATLIVQKALALPGDGIMGPKTLAAIANTARAYEKIIAERVRFYGKLISNTPSQATFAAGWMDRVADFISPN